MDPLGLLFSLESISGLLLLILSSEIDRTYLREFVPTIQARTSRLLINPSMTLVPGMSQPKTN